jgi:hypothetical protein
VQNSLPSDVSLGAIVNFKKQQLHLDTGELQQGGYGPLVRDIKRWLHVLPVKASDRPTL